MKNKKALPRARARNPKKVKPKFEIGIVIYNKKGEQKGALKFASLEVALDFISKELATEIWCLFHGPEGSIL